MERNILVKGIIHNGKAIPCWDPRLKFDSESATLDFKNKKMYFKLESLLFDLETKEVKIPNLVEIKKTSFEPGQEVFVEEESHKLRYEVIDRIKWSTKNCNYYSYRGDELVKKTRKLIKDFDPEKTYTFIYLNPVFYFKSGNKCEWGFKLYTKIDKP